MKCLMCKLYFYNQDIEFVKKNHVDVHKIDKKPRFYEALFKKSNMSIFNNKCLRCDELIFNEINKRVHNFLKHLVPEVEIQLKKNC